MRLDKLLANAGIGSRTEVKAYIKAGRVRIGDSVAKKPDQEVKEADPVFFDGRAINTATYRYFLINKPAGMITATEDKKQTTVLELLPKERPQGLFPVGRLDKDTRGLILITNDGDLGHRLLSPKRHVDKVYLAELEGCPGENQLEAFRTGLDLGDFVTEPADISLLACDREAGTSLAEVTIHEGKFHQVKRMFEAIDCRVTGLKRTAFGPWRIDQVPEEGSFIEIEVDREAIIEGRYEDA